MWVSGCFIHAVRNVIQ